MSDYRSEPEISADMSVIGHGIKVIGNIEATVDIHLQGEVHGDLKCATLIMDEGSLVHGSVHAERVKVSGTVKGSIDTQDIAVEAEARIDGDVTYLRIRIANGGIVDGKMTHRGDGEKKLKLVEPSPPKKGSTPPVTIE
jgi:cytoskeletal protein CcmA (bactofilin family)